jgi:hypothetical protein
MNLCVMVEVGVSTHLAMNTYSERVVESHRFNSWTRQG